VDITKADFINSPFYLAQTMCVYEPNQNKINGAAIGPIQVLLFRLHHYLNYLNNYDNKIIFCMEITDLMTI
jgi:hypothetical protein